MSDYSSVARDFDEDDKIAMLNEVVCEHFLRQGKLDIAETLIEVRSSPPPPGYWSSGSQSWIRVERVSPDIIVVLSIFTTHQSRGMKSQ